MKTYTQFVSEGIAADGGLYSFRKPSTHTLEILTEWMQENQIPNQIPSDELHVSVICSEVAVPQYNPDPVPVWINPATYWVDVLGDALVLHFKNDALTRQWENANILGAKGRWPTFQPHLSLSYNVPVEFDISDVKPFPVQMILDGEQCRGMVDGWASVKGLKEYTIGDMTLGGGPAFAPIQMTSSLNGLNVAAGHIPQISETDIPEFITWLERQGIEVDFLKTDVMSLHPVRELAGEPASIPTEILTKPLITSNDNYILDGHSRWQALLSRDPHYQIATYRVDLPIRELLAIAHGFSKVSYKS